MRLLDDTDDTVNCVLRKDAFQGLKTKFNTIYVLGHLKTTKKYDALPGDMFLALGDVAVPISRKKQLLTQRQLRLPLRCNFMYPVPWNGSTFQPLEAIKYYNLRQDDKTKMLNKWLKKIHRISFYILQEPIRPQEYGFSPKLWRFGASLPLIIAANKIVSLTTNPSSGQVTSSFDIRKLL